jgi:hypothetical protein
VDDALEYSLVTVAQLVIECGETKNPLRPTVTFSVRA